MKKKKKEKALENGNVHLAIFCMHMLQSFGLLQTSELEAPFFLLIGVQVHSLRVQSDLKRKGC